MSPELWDWLRWEKKKFQGTDVGRDTRLGEETETGKWGGITLMAKGRLLRIIILFKEIRIPVEQDVNLTEQTA